MEAKLRIQALPTKAQQLSRRSAIVTGKLKRGLYTEFFDHIGGLTHQGF
jgi:hypothetical protein